MTTCAYMTMMSSMEGGLERYLKNLGKSDQLDEAFGNLGHGFPLLPKRFQSSKYLNKGGISHSNTLFCMYTACNKHLIGLIVR